MIAFRYRARTAAGELVRGSVHAADAQGAAAAISERALFVTAVTPERHATNHLLRLWPRSSSTRSRVAFFRCFATLIAAGVPLRRALAVSIERCEDRALLGALIDVHHSVERGDPLSSALRPHPREFSPLVVAMIAAGETGGILDDVLSRIATFLERDLDLRTRMIAALAYPATVLVASIALIAFLIVRVIPMFATLFASFHVPLPPATQAMLTIGVVLSQPSSRVATAIVVAAIPLAIAGLRRSSNGRHALDRLRFRIPVSGRLARTAITARLARMLGTLVHAGVDLNAAFAVLVSVSGSELYAAALQRIALALREGEPLAQPLGASGLFDPMLITLVGVGEETGMLDDLLITAAAYFEADVSGTIATLAAVLEPALILFLGAIVGAIVSSVFVPLYALIGGVAQ